MSLPVIFWCFFGVFLGGWGVGGARAITRLHMASHSRAVHVAPVTRGYGILTLKRCLRSNTRFQVYAKELTVQDVLEKHSNFVGFPVHLNGKHINTVEPMWTRAPSTVTKEEHAQFYRFVAGAFDEPLFTLCGVVAIDLSRCVACYSALRQHIPARAPRAPRRVGVAWYLCRRWRRRVLVPGRPCLSKTLAHLMPAFQ